MMLSASAGTINSKSSENPGSLKPGRTRGTSVTSPTNGTTSKLDNAANAEAPTMASTREYWLMRLILPSRTINRMVVRPTITIGRTMLRRFRAVSRARPTGFAKALL